MIMLLGHERGNISKESRNTWSNQKDPTCSCEFGQGWRFLGRPSFQDLVLKRPLKSQTFKWEPQHFC